MKDDQPSAAAYASAAWLLMCEERALRAVAKVESGPEGAFLDTGEPVILYEAHVFHRLTGGRFYGARAPDLPDTYAVISWPTWNRHGYGPTSVQHRKLQAAQLLDHDAAIKACSWGLFQLLGEGHVACGYPILQRFTNAMYRSADDHLKAFTMFIRHDAHLLDALRAKQWATLALYYNGTGFRKNRWDEKMAAAYDELEHVHGMVDASA